MRDCYQWMMRRHATGLIAIALAVLITAIGLTVILLFSSWPQPWPGQELRIKDETGQPLAVEKAVTSINHSGTQIRLTITNDDPQVVIRKARSNELRRSCGSTKCVGHASFIGYRGQDETVIIDKQYLKTSGRVDELIVHELGHILGLEHNSPNCHIMSQGQILENCPIESGWQRCGFQRDELIKLGKLYGRSSSSKPWCPLLAANSGPVPTAILVNGREVVNQEFHNQQNLLIRTDGARLNQETPAMSRSFNRR